MAIITSPRTESPTGNAAATSPSRPYSSRETETPTSSVRASVELTHNNGSTTASKTDNVANQRRHRAALRDYYKLKSQLPSGADGSNGTASVSDSKSPSPAPPPVNDDSPSGSLLSKLDDPSFEADKFVSSLLASGSLQEILRTEAVLVSEIRNLDGECKALVYDNYSKLIKAVGTIGDMQKGMQRKQQQQHPSGRGGDDGEGGGLDGVEKLEGKLRDLETVARELNPTAGEGDGRCEVKERRKIRKQKGLVRWVLAAPAHLENLCKADKREDAELEWARVKQLLDQWEDVKGVEDVRVACVAAMKKPDQGSENG
ncbi:hypothetical protein DV736_g4929, partial [Chaetothyriales sp. CBS 134916]